MDKEQVFLCLTENRTQLQLSELKSPHKVTDIIGLFTVMLLSKTQKEKIFRWFRDSLQKSKQKVTRL